MLRIEKKIRLTNEISEKQLQWRNDRRISDWTRQNGILSQAHHQKWLDGLGKDPSCMMFGALNHLDENIGTVGLTGISYVHGVCEFSCFIDPAHHRQGFGRAALIELLKYGFNHLRLNCIWGETFADNHALKMFLDLGMKEEGRARQRYFKNGEYKDSIFISILASEARTTKWWK